MLVRTLVRCGAMMFALAACSSPAAAPPIAGDDIGSEKSAAVPASSAPVSDDPCGDQAARCACVEAGRTTGCGIVTVYVGSYKLCTYGTRTCDPGTLTWTPCEGDVASASAPDAG